MNAKSSELCVYKIAYGSNLRSQNEKAHLNMYNFLELYWYFLDSSHLEDTSICESESLQFRNSMLIGLDSTNEVFIIYI